MESTFEWHQQNPDISLDAYVKARRVVLGESLSAKKLIYLDTNYWTTLHEAADKAGADAIEFRLLSALRTAWAAGLVLCSTSANTFIELMKQTDARSRHAIASLIDELSQGVALMDEEERVASRFHFLYSLSSQANPYIRWTSWYGASLATFLAFNIRLTRHLNQQRKH